MPYTMFRADGKPLRATVAVQNWLLDCSFHLGQTSPTSSGHQVSHELAHVSQGTSVRAWHISRNRKVYSPTATQNAFRASVGPAQFLPEIDDEVIVSFSSGTPRATAIVFNPKEFHLTQQVPWNPKPAAGRGDVGMVREGNYRVVVRQRAGAQPLALALVVSQDSPWNNGAQIFRVF